MKNPEATIIPELNSDLSYGGTWFVDGRFYENKMFSQSWRESMRELNPKKLHVIYQERTPVRALVLPRCYTLTHSDRTGDLFLTIGTEYDWSQISGWYTRLMRDEVLAEWQSNDHDVSFHVFCHVSGGVIFGSARWRNDILHHHMRMVLEAFRFADRELISSQPHLDRAEVYVHFRSSHARYHRVEEYGLFQAFA